MIATSANTGPNAAQIENWDGPGGQHWVAEAERYDRMTGAFGERIIEAAAPRPGERVLDVGCGNGAVALAVSALVAPGGSVLGLDISGPMLGCARQRADAAGIASVSFRQGDAQVYPLPTASFDAVVSRFGVMFFDDPVAAFTNLGRALRPGGRIAFTCWRELAVNDWLMVPAGAALQHVPMPDLASRAPPGRSRWPTPSACTRFCGTPPSRRSPWRRSSGRCRWAALPRTCWLSCAAPKWPRYS